MPVSGDLPHLAGREPGGQAAGRERFLPAAAGRGAGLQGMGDSLFGERHLVGEHVHRALTGDEILEPIDFGLRQRQPPVERQRGVGRDRAVQGAALLDEFVALLLGHLELVPQGVEPDG